MGLRNLYFATSPLLFRHRLTAFFSLLIVACLSLTAAANQPTSEVGNENRRRAVSTLQTALRTQPKWAKTHAAEFLLARGYPQGVGDEFLKELETGGNEPQYRIGIWRVMARASSETGQRNEFSQRILRAAIDPAGADRLHAIEALAKLGAPLNAEARTSVDRWTRDSKIEDSAFGNWLLATTTDDPGEFARHREALIALLGSDEPLARLRAAYSLRQLHKKIPANQQEAIFVAATRAAEAQPADENTNLANAQVLITGWSAAKSEHRVSDEKKYRAAIERLASADSAVARFYVDAIADLGDDADVPRLVTQLDSTDGDLASSAANALLLRLK